MMETNDEKRKADFWDALLDAWKSSQEGGLYGRVDRLIRQYQADGTPGEFPSAEPEVKVESKLTVQDLESAARRAKDSAAKTFGFAGYPETRAVLVTALNAATEIANTDSNPVQKMAQLIAGLKVRKG